MLIQSHFAGDSTALVPSSKWRNRGLVAVYLGNQAVWTAWHGWRRLTPAGGPKSVGSKFGRVAGFASTFGTGTTDRLDGGFVPRPSSGWRSIVSHYYALSTGGSGIGRIFQDASGNGTQAGETLTQQAGQLGYIVYTSGSFGHWDVGSGFATGRWQSIGLTHDQRTVGVVPTFYHDGAVRTTNTTQTPSGAYTTLPCNLVWGNRPSDSARCWDGLIGPTLFFDGALSAAEHAELDRDPYKVFAPDELFVWIPDSAGGDASASLTGSSGTSSTGAVAPSLSASLSGVSAASAAGSVSPATGVTSTVSGTTSTAAAGTLSPAVSRAVTGSQVSTVSGTTTTGLSKPIVGVAATSSAGTLSPSAGATASISGVASATATGALAATLSITLAGTSATTSVGTLALPGSYSAVLTASQTTTSAGAATPSISKAIVGVQSAAVSGASASVGITKGALGGSVATSVGALAASISITLAGTSANSATGSLSVPGSYSAALGSSALSSLIGSLDASVSVGVSGGLATASAGTLTRTTAVIGSHADTAVGALTVSVTNAVTGTSSIASSGSVTVAGGSYSASLYGSSLTTSSGLLTVLGAIPGPGESLNLSSRIATTKMLSSPVRRSVSLVSRIPQ